MNQPKIRLAIGAKAENTRSMLFRFSRIVFIVAGLLVATRWPSLRAETTSDAFQPVRLQQMDQAILACIQTNGTPGAVFWLERHSTAYHKSYGERALVPNREPMTDDTLFDAASLTKVLATTPAVLLLIERGEIALDSPAVRYLPEFETNGKDKITIRHLLTHTSGLRPDLSLAPAWSGYDKAIELACAEKLVRPPGTTFRYSDINFIVLGEIVHRVSGQSLADFVQQQIYRPLGMVDTGYLPSQDKLERIAPTEKVDGEILRGVVHDPTARRMGGVAGHAGLFTTAADLARFARMMLNEGSLDGVSLFKPETVRLMTSVQSPDVVPARRGLGWDIDSGYSRPRGKYFPLGSYGHTGFTGTCLWIDPFSKTFWIFLSNRVHPDGKGNVLPLEGALGTLAAEAVVGFNFAGVLGSLPPREEPDKKPVGPGGVASATNLVGVLNGIDVLKRNHFAPLKGLKIGLITNHTGTDRERNPTIDLLHSEPDLHLAALFSPEHGIRGALDQNVSDSRDERTGLPIYSLYGERHAPAAEQLKDLDALVFDIQDVGCRFYTYISTMGYCLEAAARAHLKYFVLDRVDPINGVEVDGPLLTEPTSFTAFHPLPVRYGMTIGELARLFNSERHLNADLTVIPVEGWSRGLWFDQTELPWINPSPNMRSLTEAMLYPGVGLLETTHLSVGRGTGTPFEIVGAPYINDLQLALELNQLGLAGVRFIPVHFTPSASVFKDQVCAGVSILLTDREQCHVVDIGMAIATTLQRLYPKQFGLEKFNRLLGNTATIQAVRDGESLAQIRASWAKDLQVFEERRAPYLLYK
jgi:uncharacterized protein YbbC (DUF1343 family)/CubicO group peptidase (beta-lactamase class C family)